MGSALDNQRLRAFSIAYVVLSLVLVATTYQLSLRAGLDRLTRSGKVVVEQSADRLIAQLESYRELTDLMARHPQISALIEGRSTSARTSEFLLRISLITGAKEVHTLDSAGRVLASSAFEDHPQVIGTDWSDRPDVIAAKTRRMGVFHSADRNGQRSYYFARSVLRDDGSPQGYVVVKVNMDELEAEWRIDETVVTFFDAAGVGFVSNRLGLALRRDETLERVPPATFNYPERVLSPLPGYTLVTTGGKTLWQFQSETEMPNRALVTSQDIPLIEMTARAFVDARPALSQARLLAALAAALLSLFGLAYAVFVQSRARLADQLRLEAEANSQLEARVAKRNTQLQQAQDNLVQASKLTALGQMSAGISHELNQPIAAIQNYAANAKKLIERGREPEASENLTLISEQTQRMARIIHNLRGFSRKETEPLERVNVASVLNASIGLAAQRAKSEGISLKVDAAPEVWVDAGQVRLQQVIVNLFSNAMDAMTDSPRKEITVSLSQRRDQVQLVVSDTGPGLSDIGRAFEPFYTTKEIGASKGLGLGLSISYGIIGSFGGLLSVENLDGGGAAFTITLPALSTQEAAQ
ncbi:two-component system C4-dicarboxylate transport sensor histidine kinase DctB [Litoreibacter meonggei]|uniref:C4-dicarboxylate transport sensor protein DctB n=1 Tax=Litoreibacter meonggei TaxID=1049199 RepID=A0A497X3F9_9RHOB|nr:ATP-binding protein [Litoreibacter meonggei]RLJ59529.1 two-component system C4-dicarboxylate transport sensor histidine kinase DctB [Litoreibacter meonggei]